VDLLTKTTIRTTDPNESEKGFGLYPGWVFDKKDGLPFPGRDREYTPLSSHLRQVLREPMKEYISEESDYDAVFDRLEYLFSLRFWRTTFQNREYAWAPLGGFAWRSKYSPQLQIMRKMDEEIELFGSDWLPLKSGVLEGPIDELKKAKQGFDSFIERQAWGS
jgi:hypothetical protein